MDLGPMGLVKALLPKTPFLLKTALLNTLSLSPSSSKQDLRTELTVSVIRELMKRPTTIAKSQRATCKDPGIKGKTWIAKVTFPKPEDSEGLSPMAAIELAIKALGDGSETYIVPDTQAVEAEWTGFRSGVDANAPRPDLPEAEQYERLMAEVKSDVTVLYFHGGAHIVMDPCTHRLPVSHLAKLTSGRCLSVRYRLAPSSPFPAALLDALIAYLCLLHPPPSSLHAPVSPSKIIFAGDSAGGQVSLSLLLTLLTLRDKGIHSIRFHGVDVALSLPAGLALNSPWCDVTLSLPSWHGNTNYDYLTPPPDSGGAGTFPPDDLWPTTPPRVEMFANASALIHPLVTPLAAPSEMWRGAPPTYSCFGTELLEDEGAVLARKMHNAGVNVRFDWYEGMPHCFAMLLLGTAIGRECMRSWAGFMRNAVEGDFTKDENSFKATSAKAFSHPVHRVHIEWEELKKELTDEQVERLLRAKRDRFVGLEDGLVKEWRAKQEEEQCKPRL